MEKSEQQLNLSYEEAIEELEDIVKSLERGEGKLEESAKLYERGVILAKHCSAILKNMQEKLSVISLSADGEIVEKEVTLNE